MTSAGPLHGPLTFAAWLRTCTVQVELDGLAAEVTVEAELDGLAAELRAEVLPGLGTRVTQAPAPARPA